MLFLKNSHTTNMVPDTGRNVVADSYNVTTGLLRKGVRTVRSNFILLLCCIAFVTGLVALLNVPRKNLFKASFTVAYDDLVRKIYGDRLYKINLLVQRGEYPKVAYYLGVNDQTAKS